MALFALGSSTAAVLLGMSKPYIVATNEFGSLMSRSTSVLDSSHIEPRVADAV
jgi:hypothetical protein